MQILANYAGAETDGLTTNRFSDVSSGAWYMPALALGGEERLCQRLYRRHIPAR